MSRHLTHLAACLMSATLAHAGVVLENDTESAAVKVTIGGEHFTTYHYGSQRHVPFLWPVIAEGGVGITRGGTLTNAEGRQGEAKVYGTPSPWMDYTGTVEGHGKRGVTIFDHPENFRPGYWHVRDYGLASINPFGRRSVGGGENGAHTLPNGESLTLRYRLLVHSGDHEEAGVAAHHARYLADESVKTPIEIKKP